MFWPCWSSGRSKCGSWSTRSQVGLELCLHYVRTHVLLVGAIFCDPRSADFHLAYMLLVWQMTKVILDSLCCILWFLTILQSVRDLALSAIISLTLLHSFPWFWNQSSLAVSLYFQCLCPFFLEKTHHLIDYLFSILICYLAPRNRSIWVCDSFGWRCLISSSPPKFPVYYHALCRYTEFCLIARESCMISCGVCWCTELAAKIKERNRNIEKLEKELEKQQDGESSQLCCALTWICVYILCLHVWNLCPWKKGGSLSVWDWFVILFICVVSFILSEMLKKKPFSKMKVKVKLLEHCWLIAATSRKISEMNEQYSANKIKMSEGLTTALREQEEVSWPWPLTLSLSAGHCAGCLNCVCCFLPLSGV